MVTAACGPKSLRSPMAGCGCLCDSSFQVGNLANQISGLIVKAVFVTVVSIQSPRANNM